MRKVNLIKSDDIDKSKWDACIKRSSNRSVYGCSWYLDVVSDYWDALVYGDYELVFPVVFKKKIIFKTIYHPFFCQQLGPFSSNLSLLNDYDLSYEILNFLFHNYRKFEFSINHDCVMPIKRIINQFPTINYIERVNLELDLKHDYNTICSNYNQNTKRNLKKSRHYKFEIKEFDDVDKFIYLYKKNIGYKSNLKGKHYRDMRNVIATCIDKKYGLFYALFDNLNNILACAFFVSCFDRDILLFNVSNHNMDINVMTVLIDKYIFMNSAKDKILDFEGSSISSIKRFYKGFGSVEKNYMHIIK